MMLNKSSGLKGCDYTEKQTRGLAANTHKEAPISNLFSTCRDCWNAQELIGNIFHIEYHISYPQIQLSLLYKGLNGFLVHPGVDLFMTDKFITHFTALSKSVGNVCLENKKKADTRRMCMFVCMCPCWLMTLCMRASAFTLNVLFLFPGNIQTIYREWSLTCNCLAPLHQGTIPHMTRSSAITHGSCSKLQWLCMQGVIIMHYVYIPLESHHLLHVSQGKTITSPMNLACASLYDYE